MQEQVVRIELFGQPYTFKAESEHTDAQRVADSLVREVARVQGRHPGGSMAVNHLTIMILAALNIANENDRLKKEKEDLLDGVSLRGGNLIQRLESFLGPMAPKTSSGRLETAR
jgi:cell division protein ZapA (FtsZ GTPase activity inhibitor)